MADLFTLGASAIGGAFGIGQTVLNRKYAEDLAKQDRKENYEYNEMAAENAYKRQVEMTERYMTPEAQMRHLQNAGLSPSLMYGAGGGTQGVSAPQGAGASGIQTPSKDFDLSAMMTLAQIGNLEAQTENIKAKTATEKGENELGRAQIEKLLADKGAAEASKTFTEAETKIAELDAFVKDKTKYFEISKAESLALEAEQNVYKALYEAEEKGLDVQIKSETYDDVIKQAELNTKKLVSEIQKNYADINLTKNEIYQIVQNVKLAYKEFNLKSQEFVLEQNKYNFDKFKFSKDMQLRVEEFNKKMHFNAHKAKVDAITNIVGRSFSFFVGATALRMGAAGNAPAIQSTPIPKENSGYYY